MASFFNRFLSNYFGIGTLFAIVLAIFFPYIAFSLNPYGLYILFALMYLSGFGIEWKSVRSISTKPLPVIISLVSLFIVIPIIVYVFGSVLLTEKIYVYGLVFSALTPSAAVAPFFAGIFKSNKELSFVILIASMVLAPFLIPLFLSVFFGSYLDISSVLIFKDILILVPLPIALAWVTKRFLPKPYTAIKQSLPVLNFALLNILFFIQFGTSVMKLQFNYMQLRDVAGILLIVFIQDFGLFLFLGPLIKRMKNKEDSVSVILSSSMKNIALASTILLLYSPKAAIAPAIGFIAHAFLFTPILLRTYMNKVKD